MIPARDQPAGRPLARWAAILALEWVALGLLEFTHSMWEMPSYLADAAPGLYGAIAGLFPPGWIGASRDAGAGRVIASLLFLGLAAGLWAAYRAAVRAARTVGKGGVPSRRRLAGIMGAGLLFGALTLPWPGLFSGDVFLYAAYGKMQIVYGLNPLLQGPSAMAGDPWRAWAPWQDLRSAYGPLWIAVTWGVAGLAQALGGDRVVYLLAFKLLNLSLLAAGTVLVWACARRLGGAAESPALAALGFAWCPLIVFDLVGNSHNDMLLIVLVLAALWCHLRGAWPLAVAALVAAGLVKLPGFFLLPAYLVLLARTSGSATGAARRIAGAGAVTVAVVGLVTAPYAAPGLLQALLTNPVAGFFAASPVTALRRAIIDGALALRGAVTPAGLTERQVGDWLRWPLWDGAFALWGVLALGFSLRPRDTPGLLRAWAGVLLSYLLIAAVWFQPWYVTWLVPLAALLPAGRLRRALLLLALCATLVYGVGPTLPGDTTPNLRHYYVPAVLFLPVLLYGAWAGARALRRRSL